MYWTEQRRDLYRFFNDHPHQQFSAKDIAKRLSEQQISMSTIYRNLSAMAEAGILRRSIKEETHEIMYQYTDSEQCRGSMHMICVQCGGTFHVEHEAAAEIQRNLEVSSGFRILKDKCILYGTCRVCAGGKQ